jgi:hypothetical protein
MNRNRKGFARSLSITLISDPQAGLCRRCLDACGGFLSLLSGVEGNGILSHRPFARRAQYVLKKNGLDQHGRKIMVLEEMFVK